VADEIKAALGLETELISGNRGEFTVWVDDIIVAQKSGDEFPDPSRAVEQVRAALG